VATKTPRFPSRGFCRRLSRIRGTILRVPENSLGVTGALGRPLIGAHDDRARCPCVGTPGSQTIAFLSKRRVGLSLPLVQHGNSVTNGNAPGAQFVGLTCGWSGRVLPVSSGVLLLNIRGLAEPRQAKPSLRTLPQRPLSTENQVRHATVLRCAVVRQTKILIEILRPSRER
jgi:hypothetical protein